MLYIQGKDHFDIGLTEELYPQYQQCQNELKNFEYNKIYNPLFESYTNETNKDLKSNKREELANIQDSEPCPYMPDITREQLCESLHSTIIGIENHRNQLEKKINFGKCNYLIKLLTN